LTSITDSLGSRTQGYNNQGLRVSVSNAAGQQWSGLYDVNDRLSTQTEANAGTTTQTTDWLGRLDHRSSKQINAPASSRSEVILQLKAVPVKVPM
jgi:YD repeat-containing protein